MSENDSLSTENGPRVDPRRALIQRLEGLQGAGVTHLPRPSETPAALPSAAEAPTAPPPAPSPAPTSPREEMPKRAPAAPAIKPVEISKARTLKVLSQEVADCTACTELAATRTQTVFGVGDPKARLCFMGEAPGADEDRLGEPFVGRSGQLLTKIIEACTLSRDEVYILNVLKCRPPGNRNPAPEESAACRRFLIRQLELIKPEYLCLLGAVAAHNLLETNTPIGKLRGKTHDFRGIKVVCTYHPAYLLRNPPAKKDAWEDMKRLMDLMGIELP
ncbi:Uracil DNA glycosylase superfamily protein [Pseudobythopirellula maris]|uniref:Type-4 uracil-DNA glycosylase n=1 Tax=Pseudobythopirellula maris TaxID=2527991 RepID=A0A5C5ZME9_9BACT|nr:uracil-DNA glycosylase [Pseudobythopirellula maris]TWT88632.1 Uracil DNA glycosylase superfamily protein [Pseudobythopirellula maris]